MKFNLFNWILETVSTIIVVLIKNAYSTTTYLLIISCGTPLVYYLGIEENRRLAQARFREHVKMFKKNKNNKESRPLKNAAWTRFQTGYLLFFEQSYNILWTLFELSLSA